MPGESLIAMSEFQYRVGVEFAGNTIQIRSNSPAAERIANFVFRHHLCPEVSEFCVAIDILAQHEGAGFGLLVGDELAAIALGESELPVTLMQLGQRMLVFNESRQAMLHAALLVRNNCGYLFPAAAGSGKTTLTAWLLGHGYSLLSDELATVGETGQLDGFTRPLNIKPGSRPLLDSFEWMAQPLAQSVVSCDVTLIPWGRKPESALSGLVIVNPCYSVDASLSIERLSPGICTKELMGSLLNARNLPKHGLISMKALAVRWKSYRVRYSRLQEVSAWLDQVVPSTGIEPVSAP